MPMPSPPSRSPPWSRICPRRIRSRGSSSDPLRRWVRSRSTHPSPGGDSRRHFGPLWSACVPGAVSTPTRIPSRIRDDHAAMVTSSFVMRPRLGPPLLMTLLSRMSSMARCACVRGPGCIRETHGQHAQRDARGRRPIVPGTLLLVEVTRLPQHTQEPQALWLWWHTPQDLRAIPNLDRAWRAYVRRFDLEHTFRFPEAIAQLDASPAAPPRTGGSLDLAGGAGLYSVASCPTARARPAAAVAAGPAAW
jgi:hypothetical protein